MANINDNDFTPKIRYRYRSYRYFEIYWLRDVTNVHSHPYHICHGSTGHLEINCRNDIKHGAISRRYLSHDAAAVSPVCRGVHVQCARQGEEPPTHQCLLQPQPAQPLLLQPGLRADAPHLLALQELRGQGTRCGVSIYIIITLSKILLDRLQFCFLVTFPIGANLQCLV